MHSRCLLSHGPWEAQAVRVDMDSFIHSLIHLLTVKPGNLIGKMPQICRTEEDRFQGRCFQLRVSGISDILMGFYQATLCSSPCAPVKVQSS